jgi:ATP-dependent Lon protease
MQDFSKGSNSLLRMVQNWAKWMCPPKPYSQFIKGIYEMDEEMDVECCEKAEKIDREVLDINSDKFDIDVWKVFTREKLIRQKERAEKERACKEALKEIKEEIGYKDEDDDHKSFAYKLKKDCEESWLSKEDLEKYKQRYKDIRDEQDLIMTSLINLSFPNDFMKSSYVQQYKQLEAQKMIVVDTIMNSYGGRLSAGHSIWNDKLTGSDPNTVYAEVQ